MDPKSQVRFQFRGGTKNNLFPECPQFDSSRRKTDPVVDPLMSSVLAQMRYQAPASEHFAAQTHPGRMARNLLQLKTDRVNRSNEDRTPNLGASAHNLIVVWLRKQSAPTAGGES
jgi:hypothetical protein